MRQHLEHDPGDRADKHVAHGDGDGRHDQQRLDDQERHEKDQQNQRRRKAVDQGGEGLLEPGPRYESDDRPT